MYKDKDRQRQAVKGAVRRYRAKVKGITSEGVCDALEAVAEGVISCNTQPDVIPLKPSIVIPEEAELAWQGPLTKERQVSQKGFNVE